MYPNIDGLSKQATFFESKAKEYAEKAGDLRAYIDELPKLSKRAQTGKKIAESLEAENEYYQDCSHADIVSGNSMSMIPPFNVFIASLEQAAKRNR
jgi:hypothetical protein